MELPSPIPESLAEMIAARMRTIGDPTRIRLLDALRREERPVGVLAETLQMSQQNVSKHLGVLLRDGIVGRRKEGTTVYYRVTDASVYDLCEQVCGGLQDHLKQLSTLMEPIS
jgi:DNA-binding transcriptional ArsR family regulator